jgi:hypothetical protein
MGYYSSFSYEIQEPVYVNPDKIKEIEKKCADEKMWEDGTVSGFADVKFSIEKRNGKQKLVGINLADTYAKFYDDRFFAEALSKAIVEGKIRLHFVGEDGTYWGYEISNGKLEELQAVVVSDTEYRMLRYFLKGNFAEGIKKLREHLCERSCQLLTELGKRLEEGVYPLHIMYDDVFSYALEVKDGAHLVLIANDSLPAYDADPESVEDLAAVVDALESLRAKS